MLSDSGSYTHSYVCFIHQQARRCDIGHVLVYVGGCGVTGWITRERVRPHVLSLVDPNVINVHLSREAQVFEVWALKGWRHAEVHDQVLCTSVTCTKALRNYAATHMRLFGYESLGNVGEGIGTYAGRGEPPCLLALAEPGDVACIAIAGIAPPLESVWSIPRVVVILTINVGERGRRLLIWLPR
jgi:hypothetical protein